MRSIFPICIEEKKKNKTGKQIQEAKNERQ